MEKVLVIVGPTGVGKTNLSIQLAKQYDGEIISGDSMQIYQEMSIGTAKIKEDEKQGIPHYLVDEYHFDEEYNVKIFQQKARDYIHAINAKKKLAMIVGGTGLYVKSVIYDYQFLDQKEDTEFLTYLKKRSNDELWSLLKILDTKACENIHHNNRQRIIRALSMAHDGIKKSEVIACQDHKPVYDAFIIGLTMERDALYERINQRVDQMMEEGLFEEINELVTTHENVWQLQSFQGIGYKEWKAYFEKQCPKEACIEQIKKNSRNFAKRQYTWFRNQMKVHWYDIADASYQEQLRKDVESWLHQ